MGGLFDGTGFLGTGLFESSDISTWSTGEIVAIALGFFVVYSVFSTTSRGVSTVSRKVKYVAATGERRRQSKAARLRAQARALEGEGGGKSKNGLVASSSIAGIGRSAGVLRSARWAGSPRSVCAAN
jgi:hypothetical protein